MKIRMKLSSSLLLAASMLCSPYLSQGQESEPPHPRYHSAQRPYQPPLPFNPFPELPVVEVLQGIFVFDDTDIDYGALLMSSSSAPSPPGSGGGGGGTNTSPIYYPAVPVPGVPWVAITKNPPSGFFLDVSNLNVGTIYGVVTKPSLDPDIFNTWNLAAVFEAVAPTERFSGSATAPMRVYAAADLDDYAGPNVLIVSPQSGSTVSGDVPLVVGVRDVFPLLTVEVFVGPTLAGSIRPGQGGRISVPSYWFPNGAQEIWVRAVNEGTFVDTDGDGVADSPSTFQAWANVTVSFSNEVYMTSYSPLYSAFGSITLDYFATTPQLYTFEVFKLSGELLHTQSGASIDGKINPQWNFTDSSGNPVNDGGYVFSLTPTPAGMAAAGRVIRTTNFFDKGVTVAKYVISFGELPQQDLNDLDEAMNNAVSSLANQASFYDEDIIGPNREAHGTIRANFTSVPYAIRKATQTNDLAALTNALADPLTGSWLCNGHSGPGDMFPGGDKYIEVRLRAADVAALLGNNISSPLYTNLFYNRRLFSTMLIGCSTANGVWPIATGTPHFVRQLGNPWIKKSAFIGFTGQCIAGEAKTGWTVRIHEIWIDGVDYDTSLGLAFDLASQAYPDVVAWGPTILGYRVLRYNGEGSW